MKAGGVIAALATGMVGLSVLFDVAQAQARPLRPPGALPDGGFDSLCVRCGRCIEACPYQAIEAAPMSDGAAAGTPTLDVRSQACRLCADFPCIEACPTGALSPVAARQDVRMGTAVIDEELCLSYKAMRCEVCYRACPLIDEAITIDARPREGDEIHAVFAPVVNEDACTGCGLCVQRCVVSDPACAIRIEPAT